MSEHTKELDRYTFVFDHDGESSGVFPDVEGEYVSWKDYAALQSANADLVAWCGDLHKALLNLVVEVDANKMLVSASTHSMINAALAKHKGGGK